MRAFGAALALSLAAGCADQPTPPPTTSGYASEAELAGAWYQVYFDTDSYAVNARGEMIAKTVAYVVTNNANTRVTVIGKTDRVGTPAANMALSERRAEAVRDALVRAGVPAARIDTTWTGEGRQAAATADDVSDQRNRVVDVTVVKLAR
ncbi:hypothetical protein STAQ_50170 [Allostella sp. ATCC 35155]|nr:hypothetical protein STAQ_50170 [Stella sp. ATCC 35155]